MNRPKLLDLFCGAGGATKGFQRAGFYVVGVDDKPQPNYCGDEFVQADATTFPLDGFAVCAGSPPCHDHSTLRSATGRDHGTAWMLRHTIERFAATGLPYVVENVGAADLSGLFRVVLCGSQFGLGAMCADGAWRQLRRHRQFVSNVMLMQPDCRHHGQPVGVYGNGGGQRGVIRQDGTARSVMATAAERRAAMGIDWMLRGEIAQSIPPAYTEFIGEQLLAHVAEAGR